MQTSHIIIIAKLFYSIVVPVDTLFHRRYL